jgi:signal transduction histidine kinase
MSRVITGWHGNLVTTHDAVQIAEDLRQALKARPVDTEKVLTLALQLSALDPNYAHFSVDAGHISRLGLELVAKQQTALSELVKNAYDADATEATVTFKNADVPGGTLEIWDNGSGMSHDELIDGFMRLSTTSKQSTPISPAFGRRRAGRKGIGRFAAQRLGERLTVVTQKDGAPDAVRLSIDWAAFKSGRDLQAVRNRIELIPARAAPGTTLTIERLRDAWSEADVRSAYQAIIELVQPFPLARIPRTLTSQRDPGFSATFLRDAEDRTNIVADPWSEYFQYALAEVTGTVDARGKATYHLRSERYRVNEYVRPKERVNLLTGVRFRAYYFIPPEVPKQLRTIVTKRLRESGGIRIYRNNFRILPYGEQYTDWLGLDTSSRRRGILPPHANLNFLGFVEITDPSGERFEETSSREGLVENAAYRDLQRFVFSGIIQLVLRVGSARGKKLQAGARKKPSSPLELAGEILNDLPEGTDPATAGLILQLGETGETLLAELRMMRILATLGLTLAEFTHEVALGFSALTADVATLREEFGGNKEALRLTARLGRQISSLTSYIDYFEETVRDNVTQEIQPVDVGELIHEFEDLVRARNTRQDIALEVDVKNYVLRAKPMHISEFNSILTNLYTNSVKAIKTAGAKGRIGITTFRGNGGIIIDFSDNGCGIKETHRDQIFDAFFTTTNDHNVYASEAQHMRGMGLGLKIVKDIVLSNGGHIALVQPRPGFNTTFRIELPEAVSDGQ